MHQLSHANTGDAHNSSIEVLLMGWAGSPGLMLPQLSERLHNEFGPRISITHLPHVPESKQDIELTQRAPIIFIQGFGEPADVDPILTLLHKSNPQILACAVPCAAEILEQSTAPTPGVKARLRSALQTLAPDALEHAIRLALHSVSPNFPDPGALNNQAPSGEFRLQGVGETSISKSVGIMLSSFQVANQDTDVAQQLGQMLEQAGYGVRYWAGDPTAADTEVELWINLSGFTLAGTHANPRVPEGISYLSSHNIPLLTPVILQRTSKETWMEHMTGLTPGQLSMNVAIPEFEGATFPWVVAYRGENQKLTPYLPGLHLLAQRAIRTIKLRRTPVQQRKISITLFGHDSDGTIGTAAHLDVFASLWRFLKELKTAGYQVEVPTSTDELIQTLLGGGEGQRNACSIATQWPAAAYIQALENVWAAVPGGVAGAIAGAVPGAVPSAVAPNQTSRIDRLWGRAPGHIDTDGRSIDIRGAQFGNIFIGIQPDFGDYADPLNVLMAEEASPSHSFAAYYLWLNQEFQHHLMLHWGTHGALEFMPGRSSGMIAPDWPMQLTAATPHAYLYAMSNPAEGTIAKRRSAAGLVSYLTPQLARAGLHGALAAVAEECQRLQSLCRPLAAADCVELQTLVAEADLTEYPAPDRINSAPPNERNTPAADDRSWSDWVQQLQDAVEKVRATPIPAGLHIVGEAIPAEKTRTILELACTYPSDSYAPFAEDHSEEEIAALIQAVMDEHLPDSLSDSAEQHWYRHLLRIHRLLSSSAEMDGLLHAIAGDYIPPTPGGEPASHPDALPTGRNTHGTDPATMPTPTAVRRGSSTAEALIQSHVEESGSYPESIAIVIWGMDNVKTRGEGIAQVFRLIGAEPCTDQRGRVSRYRILPLEELGRPRIDVVCTMSGVGRDLLSGPMHLLDAAIREIAALDEPDHCNFLRKHAHANQDEGLSAADAAARIFAMSPGNYGTGVNKVIQASTWDCPEDLAEVYLHRMAHVWGENDQGTAAPAALRAALQTVETTFQNVDSTEISLAGVDHYFEFLGGVTSVVESATGKKPKARVSHAWQQETNVESLEDAMRLESRTRLLNPTWYEAQLRHGYQGVATIRTRLENTFGMQATAHAIDDWVFDRAAETFVLDDQMRERMSKENPAAVLSMANRLVEAAHRELWDADPETLAELEELVEDLDDQLEGLL